MIGTTNPILEIVKRFEKTANDIETGSTPGQISGYGKAYAHAGASHADMVRSVCKDIRQKEKKRAKNDSN
jgi:hypothetical protein